MKPNKPHTVSAIPETTATLYQIKQTSHCLSRTRDHCNSISNQIDLTLSQPYQRPLPFYIRPNRPHTVSAVSETTATPYETKQTSHCLSPTRDHCNSISNQIDLTLSQPYLRPLQLYIKPNRSHTVSVILETTATLYQTRQTSHFLSHKRDHCNSISNQIDLTLSQPYLRTLPKRPHTFSAIPETTATLYETKQISHCLSHTRHHCQSISDQIDLTLSQLYLRPLQLYIKPKRPHTVSAIPETTAILYQTKQISHFLNHTRDHCHSISNQIDLTLSQPYQRPLPLYI